MVFFNEKDIIKGHFPNGEKQCLKILLKIE